MTTASDRKMGQVEFESIWSKVSSGGYINATQMGNQ